MRRGLFDVSGHARIPPAWENCPVTIRVFCRIVSVEILAQRFWLIMHRSVLHRCLVSAWAVWFLVGMTLAVSHSHDHADCAVAKRDHSAAQTASHSHVQGCQHSHKHPHSRAHGQNHSHPAPPVPTESRLPCHDDDCSLCHFLALPHIAPSSVTILGEPVCLAIVTELATSQCELPPAVTAAAPRAPPQGLGTSC